MCFCCNRLNFGVVLALLLFACLPVEGKAFFPEFEEHVINPEAGTGLAITVSDVNGDGKPDIVGVSSKDVAW
ncbi:MAG: VCBS repeat-containing protein, partial [Candidatus Omnitrophica bacterium]|nr:VCBS repeat-containing protein [Candidatus Omnitrophota bacterium]